jgi:hypothetical protein
VVSYVATTLILVWEGVNILLRSSGGGGVVIECTIITESVVGGVVKTARGGVSRKGSKIEVVVESVKSRGADSVGG